MTTILTPFTLTLPTADLGPDNPLPAVRPDLAQPYTLRIDDSVPEQLRRNTAYGNVRSIHPYLLQDGYDRNRAPRPHHAVALDNGLLRAVFLPGLGGRLRSLTDLATGRELLHVNPVIQPANLALRNAWSAGGTEWNIGTRGHSPTTCAPLFAAEATAPDGGPALRMWEYERLRGLVFRIDAWLPDGEAALKVRIEIANPNPAETPVYWWSNTAVTETSGLRVLADAATAYATDYEGGLSAVPVRPGAEDWTYPGRSRWAGDWFFATPDEVRTPWEAAVGPDGTGLLHTSTARLRGRKLFVWGQNPGGRRWADWLTEPGGEAYAEIQGGLAHTQFEHLPMPAGARWSWIESYRPLAADPAAVHGDDWDAARAEIRARVGEEPTPVDAPCFAAPPGAVPHLGSGWGALENERRAGSGEPQLADAAVPFPAESLSAEQQPWLELLRTGRIPDGDFAVEPPLSYQAGEAWAERLAAADEPGALMEYQLAVLQHARGNLDAAERHYTASQQLVPTAWASRGAALAAAERGRLDDAADWLTAAALARPEQWRLAVEALDALRAAERPADALELVDALPAETRERGRVRLLTAQAAVAAGRPERARTLLDEGIDVPDLREGEVSFTELWEAACPGQPLPARYDFRMAGGED